MRLLRSGRIAGAIVVPLAFCVAAPELSAGNPPSLATAPAPPSAADPTLETVVVTMRDGVDLGRARAPDRSLEPRAVESRLRSHASASQKQLLARLGEWRRQGQVSAVRSLWIANAVAVTATPGVIRRLTARPDVASVRPDEIAVTPSADPTPNLVTIGSPAVWADGQNGQGVVVATLDSGVDMTDPDLAAQWRGGTNGWFDPYGQHSTPYDASGHGTGVLGVMVGGQATGSAIGVAPGATWIAARVLDDSGAGTVSGIHQAFQWLLDPDGNPATDDAPDVVNGSWAVGTGPSCNLAFQPDVQALRAAGILPVFAAGNYGSGAHSDVSPANYPESFAVGAVSGSDVVRADSSRGPSSCGGRTGVFPDLVAPGTSIPTVDRYGFSQSMSGTSAAAPHVAGSLAMLLGSHPGLSPSQQAQLLTSTAVDLGTTGPDETYGHGRLDLAAAYAATPTPPTAPTDGLLLSTVGPAALPGLPAGDDADVYGCCRGGFARRFDASAVGLAAGADIDGLDVVGTDHFYASFDRNTRLPGLGRVQDEDVVEYAAGTWSVFFDGTSHGLIAGGADVDALTVHGRAVFFSTRGDAKVRGVGGRPDDADVYRWNGTRFTRVWRATRHGVPRRAGVDGLSWTGPRRLSVSFSNDSTRVGRLRGVRDEDIVTSVRGRWSRTFDGSRRGLGRSRGLDVDAFDLP